MRASTFINDYSFILLDGMPRKRSIDDDALLDAALVLVRSAGPEALTFQALSSVVGLSPSTLVQRFKTKPGLVRAALLRAWDLLDDDTTATIDAAPDGPAGVVDLLTRLSGQYDARDFADQLRILREDLRDPVLTARGRAWLTRLGDAIEARLADIPGGSRGLGRVILAQWQGTLTVWGFTRKGTVRAAVRRSLEDLLGRLKSTDR
jgi:AcrR family transcriptional regulator